MERILDFKKSLIQETTKGTIDNMLVRAHRLFYMSPVRDDPVKETMSTRKGYDKEVACLIDEECGSMTRRSNKPPTRNRLTRR